MCEFACLHMLAHAHTCMQKGRDLQQKDQLGGDYKLRSYYINQGSGREGGKDRMDWGVHTMNAKKEQDILRHVG